MCSDCTLSSWNEPDWYQVGWVGSTFAAEKVSTSGTPWGHFYKLKIWCWWLSSLCLCPIALLPYYCPNALFICFYGIASYNGWWYYDYVMPHLQNAKMTIFCCSRRNKLTKCYKKVKMAPGRTFLAILSHQGPPPILQRAGGQYWKTNFISTIVMLKRSLLLNMIMMMMMLFWHLRGEPPEVSYGWFSIRESLVVLLVMMMILNNTYTGCFFFSLVPH